MFHGKWNFCKLNMWHFSRLRKEMYLWKQSIQAMYFLFLLQENIILKQKKTSRNNFSWGLTSNKEALFLDTLTATQCYIWLRVVTCQAKKPMKILKMILKMIYREGKGIKTDTHLHIMITCVMPFKVSSSIRFIS